MKSKISPVLIAVCFGFALAGSAHAAVVFSQTFPDTGSALTSDSGFDSGVLTADDFTLSASATVRSVLWRGVYGSADTPQAVDAFTINFYSDPPGGGTLLQTFAVGNAVNRVDTGTQLGSLTIFEYSADLGGGINLASGPTFWAAIFNDTAADFDDKWFWLSRSQTGGQFGQSADVGTSFSLFADKETYFILDNTNLNPVPLPAALPLFLSALAGLGLMGWRRRQADA